MELSQRENRMRDGKERIEGRRGEDNTWESCGLKKWPLAALFLRPIGNFIYHSHPSGGPQSRANVKPCK